MANPDTGIDEARAPRWTIGQDPDTNELLVADNEEHIIVARAGRLSERFLRMLVDAAVRSEARAQGWQPIETAPKGSWLGGPRNITDPAYVAPPHLWLLLPDGQRCVGFADAYYAAGGNGYDSDSFWVEEFSGERVRPTHWMPLPDPPRIDPKENG